MSQYENHKTIMNDFQEEATNLAINFKHEEETNQSERIKARQELQYFRKNNNLLEREAVYPESKLFHVAIIVVFILVEAVVNSYFFGKASDLGLLGGFFTGLMTSIANVMLGIIAGFLFLRLTNHIDKVKKVFGIFSFIFILPIIAFIHLAIAHYRELLTRNPDAEILSVINKVIEQPFGLEDLDSIILIVIGIFISILAIWKGYTLDDAYPGYGAVYRRWKEKEDNMIEAKKSLILSITEKYNDAIRRSNNILQNLEESKTKVEEIKKESSSFFDGYISYYQQAKDAAFRLIDTYRSGIRTILEDETKFPYNEYLLVGLEKPNLNMMDRTNKLINSTLHSINDDINSFEEKQEIFEKKLIQKRDEFIGDKAIENIFKKEI